MCVYNLIFCISWVIYLAPENGSPSSAISDEVIQDGGHMARPMFRKGFPGKKSERAVVWKSLHCRETCDMHDRRHMHRTDISCKVPCHAVCR